MTRVLSVSSSRADGGVLAPVWRGLAVNASAELHVLLTGMHMVDDAAARGALPAGAIVHKAGADLGGGTGPEGSVAAAAAMAAIAEAAARTIAKVEPDAVLVMGDRLDMFPAALAAVPFNLPIVHLHGGELSLGALDERVRHALTKLSHIHCVATVEAAERVCRMGEEPWRIHVTGAPGLDGLRQAPPMAAAELQSELGLPIAGLRLVTVHPETNSEMPALPLDAVLAALDRSPAPSVFTAPNADPGGAAMRSRIEAFAGGRPWAAFHDTLGTELYANAMRHAAVMVGNSSSGIIEAGLFDLPVINVGRRQEGRLSGPNVHDCRADADAIGRLLDRLSADPLPSTGCRGPGRSLYGDGRAAPRIVRVLTNLPERRRLLFKRFVQEEARFTAPWEQDIRAAS
ncbi:MAG: UDP-N-acetylglucosamine 2-epimerase [Kiloniellales bacterium]